VVFTSAMQPRIFLPPRAVRLRKCGALDGRKSTDFSRARAYIAPFGSPATKAAPGPDGLETSFVIRNAPETSHIPAVRGFRNLSVLIRRMNRSLPGCVSLGNNALITRRWKDVDTCSPFHVRQSCHTTRYEQSPTFCWSCPSDGKTRAARSVSSPLPINSVRSFQSSMRCLWRCTPGEPDGGRLETGWHTCRSRRRFDTALDTVGCRIHLSSVYRCNASGGKVAAAASFATLRAVGESRRTSHRSPIRFAAQR
jgi:hypothetical protein